MVGCYSARPYEDIIGDFLASDENDLARNYVVRWVPLIASSQDRSEATDEGQIESAKDQDVCIDEHRGVIFRDEAIPLLYFIQCMNEKGWRPVADEFIVIRHRIN